MSVSLNSTTIAGGVAIAQLKNAVRLLANELAVDPGSRGVAIAEGLRRLEASPIRAYFHIDMEDQAVIVDGIASCK